MWPAAEKVYPMRLGTVVLRLPQFDAWRYSVETGLDLEPGEDAHSVELPTTLRLPGVMVLDFDRAAKQAGWTLGQLLSFLVVQGTLRVVEKEGKT